MLWPSQDNGISESSSAGARAVLAEFQPVSARVWKDGNERF